jgi:hypothetical protein
VDERASRRRKRAGNDGGRQVFPNRQTLPAPVEDYLRNPRSPNRSLLFVAGGTRFVAAESKRFRRWHDITVTNRSIGRLGGTRDGPTLRFGHFDTSEVVPGN